jgi:hypothetical protein
MLKTIAASAAALLVASSAYAKIGDVFVIAMENQNSSVSGQNASGLNPLYGNPAAPYINSLITPGNPNAQYTAYSSAYHNIIYGSTDLHPSEPNYIWQVSGITGPLTDAVPSVGNGNLFPSGTANLGTSLTAAGLTWKSYQEDIDTTGGNTSSSVATNTVAPQSQWTVPNANFSGANAATYTNAYNGSNQYNYAAKHNPFVFFQDDYNAQNYAPLQQLSTDLANNAVADFNWITPDQYNDMHTALNGGFTYNGVHYTGNDAGIAQGDNFLSIIVPEIEASQAFQHNGLIVIWTDEDEGDTPSTNGNYSNMEILIGHDTKGNAFTDFIPMNHNTDLETYLQLYGLNQAGYPANIIDSNTLASLLKPGAIPEPATWAMMLVGLGLVGGLVRRRGRLATA